MVDTAQRRQHWPWLGIQIVLANLAVAAVLAVIGFISFQRQSNLYLERLMKKFDITPDALHSMYVADVQQSLWIALIIAVLVSIGLAVGLAVLIIRPIVQLSRCTEAVAAGDLSVRAPRMVGELGRLSEDFNQMVKALDQEEERRRRYLADLAHEIRTPITTLKGYTEGLEDGIFKPEAKTFAVMRGECDHLSELVGQVDLMSNFAPDPADASQETQLDQALTDALERWSMRLDKAGVAVETKLKPARVSMPNTVVHRVLDNMLSNVTRYAPSGVPLKVVLGRGESGRTQLTLSNGSAGLSAAQVERLFDRFYRADESRQRVGTNHDELASGLGLSIVRETLRRQGGNAIARLDGERLVFELTF
ncbi:MAG: histidine kinase dimerization/phospho-acceptor domain-containing protein [Alphaproteobacteria bacterium]